MFYKKLTAIYKKHCTVAYVSTLMVVLIAAVSLGGVWAVRKYWYPPVQRFTDADIARTITFYTTKGPITIAIDRSSIFPAAHFTRLAVDGFYTGTRIHRIVSDLLIEGGDPLTRDESMRHFWGEGGLSNAYKNEIHRSDVMSRGVVALSSSGSGTFGSQFFIVTRDTPWLKGKHTIIGHISKGMDVVDSIEKMPHTKTGLPVDDILITSVAVNE